MALQVDHMLAGHKRGQKAEQVGVKGRDSWRPISIGPGPAAYLPEDASTKTAVPQVVFGTASREHEEKRYVSKLHSDSMPPQDTPGPGSYRTHKVESHPNNPHFSFTPTWKFGSAPQRTNDEGQVAARSPGPVYVLPDETSAPSYSFAPMNSTDMGMARNRTDGSSAYISAAHSVADRNTSADAMLGMGPAAYSLDNYRSLSPVRRVPDVKFGKSSRDVKDSLTELQMSVEPTATSAFHTPGPIYDPPSPSQRGTQFGKAAKTYSPERGGRDAGPYLSKGHEPAQLGTLSPGPGCYSAHVCFPRTKQSAGWLGDAPTPTFGSGAQSVSVRATLGPGPSAYFPRTEPLSHSHTAPSHTLSPALRTDYTTAGRDLAVPGPGAYDVARAGLLEGQKINAAAFSMGSVYSDGRASFVPGSFSPGPAAYGLQGALETGKSKGYSFGVKERTVNEKSTVSVRFHGPLAAAEGLGTQSPGPGLYDVRGSIEFTSLGKRIPDIRFGTSTREGAQAYISKMHSEAEGLGLDSPGPGTYNHGAFDLADVTSRYRRPAKMSFGSSDRFSLAALSF